MSTAPDSRHSLPRDADADVAYRRITAQFEADVLDEANEAAHQGLRRRITLADILTGRDVVFARRAPRDGGREVLFLFSGALLGTGIQGFASEVSAQQRGLWMAIYALVGVLGLAVGAIGVVRR